ncbi:cation-translocating P-type ATPase [Nocardia higoensis]|uniref:cation-translocating P-type ATPase n=1 Tax=Nocardia higoensis TaxID=228599 RepID=UPI000A065560|nr:cation-translocating P-type ATPase [Nocardia higoensis]
MESLRVRSIGFGGLTGHSLSVVSSTTVRTVVSAQNLLQPVTRPIRESARTVLGSAEKDVGEVVLPMSWRTARRLHVDLDQVLPFPGWVRGAAQLERVVGATPGVVSAHVEGILGRIVIEREETADLEEIHRAIRRAADAVTDAATAADRQHGTAVSPAADPGDPLALVVPAVAAVVDAAAVAAAVTGWLGRLPRVPRAARAAAAMINHQPRIVALLEARLGRLGTDLLLNAISGAAHGLTQAPATPLLDLMQRTAQLSEALAHRQTWREREPELAAATRPQCPAMSVIPVASQDSGGPRHEWAPAAAGEVSHVVVDSAVDVSIDCAGSKMAGVVEDYADQAANGSLVAAAGTLLAGGTVDDIADAVLAGIPKAAHMGREGFAVFLGRGLAKTGLLVLDPGALRRLDRIRVIVIDGAALRGDTRAVLDVEVRAPDWDDDLVFEIADALLHDERVPHSGRGELCAEGASLGWHERPDAAAPALGAEHADLLVGGQVVATLTVGWELDSYSIPLVEMARRSGARVVLRNVCGTEELNTFVTAAHEPGTPLVDLVRELRADRGPVMVISALHSDFVSMDTLAALAVADIGLALDDPAAATPWTADIIAGTDLAAAVRVLTALSAARRATESAVRLAKAGTTLAGLLLVTGETEQRGGLGLGRWLSPVNAAGATAWFVSAFAARQVLRMPDPPPQPLTAWHALDPEIVFSRVLGGIPSAEPSVTPQWYRALSELSETAVGEFLLRPAILLARVADATRRELGDPLTPILAVGAAAAAILGSNVDALLVAGVMSVNAVVSGVQRLRAEHAAEALFAEQEQAVRRVVVPTVATTARRLHSARTSSRVTVVPATRLRPGDVLDLRAPEVVPADARVLIADDLEVDESSLTGESLPVDKQVEPVANDATERASMLFQGSTIVAGHARAIVVATGPATAAHRAISAVSDVAPAAGVQGRLRDLTSKVLPLTLAGGAVVGGLSLMHRGALREAVADGVAIAVAAVPEGLPLVATLAQLAAARRLSRLGVLVRSPRTLEAIGRVDTVCFDKTGTLTLNRLDVVTAVPPDFTPGRPCPQITDRRAATVVRSAARACPRPEAGEGHAHATDEAILTAAARLAADDAAPRTLAEVPFESSRGYSASIIVPADATPEAHAQLVVKGAPEVVLPRCRFDTGDQGRAAAEALVHYLADQGLRVLAVAQRELGTARDDTTDEPDRVDALATDLTLIGYVGLADTIRDSARPLLERLVAARCNVALITGDHPVTARAIARQIGFPPDTRVVTGAELAAADEDARSVLAASAQVFARVSPEQKVQVIAALQRSGRVVAMVGDGANDAAAIRMADAGIGVTGRGSSPAREAADLVLTGENLTVLLDALVEGRNMWAGVRDALTLLLGGNAGEVVFTILGTALGRSGAPVNTRQLLLVNLLTDMFPALAIAVTPPKPDTDGADADPLVSILSAPAPSLERPLVEAIVRRGVATAAAATAAWAIGRWTPGTRRRSATMGLTALVGAQLAQTLVLRQESPLVMATAVGSAAVLVAIVETPGISQFFGCTPLGPLAWGGVVAAVGATTAVVIFAPAWFTRRTTELIDRADRLPTGRLVRNHEQATRSTSSDPTGPVVP